MKKIENLCVGCKDLGLPCMGNSCPNLNVPVYYCDECKTKARCHIDGYDFCENCANKYFQELFDELTIAEKAELLKLHIVEYLP